MSKVYGIVRIKNGKIENKLDVAKMFKLEDGNYKVTLEPTKKRTLLQNSWFHAVLPEIVQGLRDAGYNEIRNEDDAKEVVKSLFFKKKVTNGIEEIEVIEKTSKTEKFHFAEKADMIITWAKDYLGIDIAPPGKQIDVFE